MKKILYLSLFLFSFIFLGISCVNASELDLSSLGYASCLDSENNVSLACGLEFNTGDVVIGTSSSLRVTNYFLVSDEFILSTPVPIGVATFTLCFYDKDFVFISCQSIQFSETSVNVTSPSNSFYARMRINNIRVFLIQDDLNSISSLNYAINSLTETVGNVFTDFTWVFLLAFSIVVIGFIIALILRVGK